jgi:hypothetical protein
VLKPSPKVKISARFAIAVDARGLRAADPVRNGKSNLEYGECDGNNYSYTPHSAFPFPGIRTPDALRPSS